jgi:hypothetical protein
LTARITPVVDSVFVLSKKKSQTIVEYLSFVGGILGLFAGFSFITVAEVLYYFIVYPLIQRSKTRDSKVYPFNDQINTTESGQLMLSRFFKKALESSSIHTFSHIGGDFKSTIERYD